MLAEESVTAFHKKREVKEWGVGVCAVVWKQSAADTAFACVGARRLVAERRGEGGGAVTDGRRHRRNIASAASGVAAESGGGEVKRAHN